MSFQLQNTTCCYTKIPQSPGDTGQTNRWRICFLLLALILGTETLITATILYRITRDLHATEALSRDNFLLECLLHRSSPGGQASIHEADRANCELLIRELQNIAHKRLLLDVQNALWQTLGEHNVTQTFRPALHAGARPRLKPQQRTADSQHASLRLERLTWEALSGQTRQEGSMRLTPDGEITVPQDGIYFVYSQVQFESFRPDGELARLIFKRTTSRPSLQLLARAGAGSHPNQQGALFRLEKGDRLSLCVSDTGAVSLFPEATYFGAFRVD